MPLKNHTISTDSWYWQSEEEGRMEGIWHKHTRRFATNRKSISEIFRKCNGKTLDKLRKTSYVGSGNDRGLLDCGHTMFNSPHFSITMLFSLSIRNRSSSGSKTLFSKAFLIWIVLSAVVLGGVVTDPGEAWKRFGRLSLRELHILLCVITFLLYKTEIRKVSRYVFLNFSIFFFYSAMSYAVCSILQNWIKWGDEWIGFFLYEYSLILYFPLLMFSVVYLAIDLALNRARALHKYLFVSLVTVTTSLSFFLPYIADRKFLYSTTDIQDYRAIRAAIEELQKTGVPKPSSDEIATVVHLTTTGGSTPANELPQLAREARVSAILPYMNGNDFQVLIYRPLWWDCFGIALVCIILLFFSIVHQFVADPPGGAYFEKVVWCFLLYCGFELLHFYAFTEVVSWEMFGQVELMGWYASMSVMLIVLSLFVVRLRFIRSIEGQYYENRLITDPTRITRWRDAFDNWILRQFMNPNELKQRFVTQSKEDTTKDITGDGS